MQLLGKRSLTSFLRAAVEIVWYALFVGIGAILVAIVLWGFFIPLRPASEAAGTFTLHAEFLSLGFTGLAVRDHRLLMVGTLSLTAIALAAAQGVVFLLRKLLSALRDRKPFSVENARLVRTIGLVVIFTSLLRALVAVLLGFLVMNTVAIPGAEVDVRAAAPLGEIFLGLVILVLGDIFRRGASLQEDHDLTV